ncbi:restriction endonuclease subunit S [Lactococcus lactis]|uniref:restriction endonuclease subunit S n=2 Tax=Lactococcus lactis TaxID=1358 RepID=UPI0020734988|nr:restriction endonuclease subunit S [Lactococcus lactis]MCM6857830.1 restriction endonuclease subunit S [Lactococcus lactis]
MAKIDDSVKKKVPELRFPGFTDDWEERKAKEMIKTHHFRSYLAEPNDVGNYEVIQQGDKPIAGYANGEPFEYFYDVTLFGDHTVSLFKPTKPFFIATDGVKIISADEFDGRYFYVTLERYKPASQGYKRHFTILKNEDIWFTTNKDEQVKIGTFFKQLDETIALHQRKLDLLKEQKKGYLQKMFPKNGAKVPELRFAGFADDWEERKLGELGKVTTGKAFSSKDFDEQGEYLVITNKDISNSSRSQNVITDRINISDKDIVEKYNLSGENILVTMDGVNLGKTAMYSNEDALLAQRVGRIQSTQLEFIYQITSSSSFLMAMRTLSVGNAIKHISLTQISNYSTLVPSNKNEQQKIGSFFKQLDDTIALHQRKLDLLKEQKKGFLQKMFVTDIKVLSFLCLI